MGACTRVMAHAMRGLGKTMVLEQPQHVISAATLPAERNQPVGSGEPRQFKPKCAVPTAVARLSLQLMGKREALKIRRFWRLEHGPLTRGVRLLGRAPSGPTVKTRR